MPSAAAKVQPIDQSATIPAFATHPSHAELRRLGKALRDKCPRKTRALWTPPKNRPDSVALIEAGNKDRIPELVPVRHGRMLQSPFTFYRGAALNMAEDLAHLPTTGIRVQCCGDAHLGNFRGFGTPERHANFDIHDLDETLPAPWEWDLKRLATSFVVACRDNAFSKQCAEEAVLTCVRSYRVTNLARSAHWRELFLLTLFVLVVVPDEPSRVFMIWSLQEKPLLAFQ